MRTRRLWIVWFLGLWLMLPWPLLVYQDAWVPAVRYLLLGSVAALVAGSEGAAGPVGLLVFLFLGWGVLTTLLSALFAWIVAKLLAHLPERTASRVTGVLLGAGLIWAVFWKPYTTPFGRALHGGLLQVLS